MFHPAIAIPADGAKSQIEDTHEGGKMIRITGVYAHLFYHFIWATKHRQPWLTEALENAVAMIVGSKAKELNLEIIAAEGAFDHYHVLLRSNQNCCPADIAKHFKGSSSHYINNKLLRGSCQRFYWQDGYGVVSVSPDAVEVVAEYVRHQKQHHEGGKLIDSLEQFIIAERQTPTNPP